MNSSALVYTKSILWYLSQGVSIYAIYIIIFKYSSFIGKLQHNPYPDVPTTINFHELKFKQLKHFLRRIIGHKAAKWYFLTHGEYSVYVNPKESREDMTQIITLYE